jgi:hydrogenase maturation protease
MKITVIGLGQSLRGDDAAGLEAVRKWQEQYPETASRPDIRVEIFELPGLALLDLLEGADAVVIVDAVQSSDPPGTILRIGPDELASFTPDAQSAHGWGVAETLKLGVSLYPELAACRITLIGIVGKNYEMGRGLSQEVVGVLPRACNWIEKEIQSYKVR